MDEFQKTPGNWGLASCRLRGLLAGYAACRRFILGVSHTRLLDALCRMAVAYRRFIPRVSTQVPAASLAWAKAFRSVRCTFSVAVSGRRSQKAT